MYPGRNRRKGGASAGRSRPAPTLRPRGPPGARAPPAAAALAPRSTSTRLRRGGIPYRIRDLRSCCASMSNLANDSPANFGEIAAESLESRWAVERECSSPGLARGRWTLDPSGLRRMLMSSHRSALLSG